MKMEDWFSLTNRGFHTLDELINKAVAMNKSIIQTINKMGEIASEQWLETHNVTSKQVENGLKIQSKFLNTQYDVI